MQLNIEVAFFYLLCLSISMILNAASSTGFFIVLVQATSIQPELWQNTLHKLKPNPSAQSVFLQDP